MITPCGFQFHLAVGRAEEEAARDGEQRAPWRERPGKLDHSRHCTATHGPRGVW